MNRILKIALGGAILLAGCKEKGPLITFTDTIPVDSTYVTAVQTPQQRNVLVEEFTGGNCANCPAAHETLSSLDTTLGDRLNIAAIHIINDNFSQSKPAEGAHFDFRTTKGTDIGNYLGGVSTMPNSAINREGGSGGMLRDDRTAWPGLVDADLATATPVNMYVTSTYDAATRVASVKVSVAYTAAVTDPHYLSVIVTEDSLIDAQEYPSHIDTAYVFNYVFRDMLTTSPNGDAFLQSLTSKEPGRYYTRLFTYTVNSAWNPAHCHVIAFVNKNGTNDKSVVQSVQGKLTGQ